MPQMLSFPPCPLYACCLCCSPFCLLSTPLTSTSPPSSWHVIQIKLLIFLFCCLYFRCSDLFCSFFCKHLSVFSAQGDSCTVLAWPFWSSSVCSISGSIARNSLPSSIHSQSAFSMFAPSLLVSLSIFSSFSLFSLVTFPFPSAACNHQNLSFPLMICFILSWDLQTVCRSKKASQPVHQSEVQ